MSFEKALHLNRLFDHYGALLTQRQREVFKYYYHEDLSYQEIADLLTISRAAVHDNISKTSKALEDYEAKLGISAFIESLEALNDATINDLITQYTPGGNYE